MDLKPSYQTGEFWMYIVFGLLGFYLQSKGIALQDVIDKGKAAVDAMGGYQGLSMIIFPLLYGAKRTWLKQQALKFDADVKKAQGGA